MQGSYVAEEMRTTLKRGNEGSERSQLYVSCIDEVVDMTAHVESQEGHHAIKHDTRNDM